MGVQCFTDKLNSSEFILWRLIPKVSILKINVQSYMKKKTITLQMKGRYSSEPQKAHLTGEFVIVAKFGGSFND